MLSKTIWSKNTFFIILLFMLLLDIMASINEINKELLFVLNKVRKDYELILERCEKKVTSLGYLLKKAKSNTEQLLLLRSYNLLKHNDYLYLSLIPTKKLATNKWFFSLDHLTGIEIYKKVYNLTSKTNILVAIDIDSLTSELIKNNPTKFYKIYFTKKETNNHFEKTFNNYFDSYILNYQLKLTQIFKYIMLNILSPILMMAGWFIIYYKIKLKYKKLYRKEYNCLLKQLNFMIEELNSKINNQNLEICSLNLQIDALTKTNLAIDCFAKDFVSSLIKYNNGDDYLKQQTAALLESFSAIVPKDKTIKYIIEVAIQYHSHALVNDNHKIVTFIPNNFTIPGSKVFGLKKVIIVSLQYLLTCSPSDTHFKFTINGTAFTNLSIEIMEQDTFVFLEDQNFTNKIQTTEKFTDLFCLSWEKLIELSKNEKIYLDKKYQDKNRYIFITTSLNLPNLNKNYQTDNVYQIYQ